MVFQEIKGQLILIRMGTLDNSTKSKVVASNKTSLDGSFFTREESLTSARMAAGVDGVNDISTHKMIEEDPSFVHWYPSNPKKGHGSVYNSINFGQANIPNMGAITTRKKNDPTPPHGSLNRSRKEPTIDFFLPKNIKNPVA